MTVTVYVYDDTHTVIVNTSANQGSTTMYDKTIKLYQGIDNTVKFALKHNDRRAVDLTNLTVTFNIVNATTNESILARPLTVTNEKDGLAELSLPASAIDDVAGTFYNYSLYTTDALSKQQVVFTDLNEAAKGTLEVVEGVASSPRITEEMSTFTQTTGNQITAGNFLIGVEYTITTPGTTDFTLIGAADSNAGTVFIATGKGTGDGTAKEPDWYYSNAVSGATERNLTSSSHTIATYTSSFDGAYKIQGNMNATASTNDADWFDITLDNGNISVTVANTTAIESYNFTTHAKWIRVTYDPYTSNSGTFEKVLLRN